MKRISPSGLLQHWLLTAMSVACLLPGSASATGLECSMCHADGLKVEGHPVPIDVVAPEVCGMCHALSASQRPVDSLFIAIHKRHSASAGLDCGACHDSSDPKATRDALDGALNAAAEADRSPAPLR